MSPNPCPTPAARLRLVALALLLAAAAQAADNDVRLVAQLAAGTAGVEPGLALELRHASSPWLILRPEILLSEDSHLGAGGAILIDVTPALGLPTTQAVAIGPRVVYHHADAYGWEADLLATWSLELSTGATSWRHAVGVLAALGAYEDRQHDDVDLGATAGVFYSYRF